MSRKKIWVVSELFYPDEASTGYIMTSIAKTIADDHDVHIICGPSGYDKLSSNEAIVKFNFTIHRIKTLNFDKNNIAGRLIRLITLSLGMFFKGLFAVNKRDTVFIVTNPAFVIPFYSFIKKVKRNKLIYLVHDVFPENLIPSGIIKSEGNFLYKITKRLFDWSYSLADLLIVLGADMQEIISIKTKSVPPVKIIENWANVDDIRPESFENNTLVRKHELNEKIVFTFAGNIGRVQGLEFLFKIIEKITNPKIHFLFVGEGAMLTHLKNEVKRSGITSVTFTGSMGRGEQNVFLNAAHFGLVTLSSALYGLGVPSKSYNIMAAGKPILFIGNKRSEIGKMVVQENCGYAFDENEELALLNFFNNLNYDNLSEIREIGLRSRNLAETKFSKDNILNKFKEVLG